jgi:2,3-bisphosphoglycerate-independent phosphoglycerate mutase
MLEAMGVGGVKLKNGDLALRVNFATVGAAANVSISIMIQEN